MPKLTNESGHITAPEPMQGKKNSWKAGRSALQDFSAMQNHSN